MNHSRARNIWIDLDNSPHVLIFEPIVRELQRQGYEVLITARDFAQTLELLELKGIQHVRIGRHYGKHVTLKVIGTLIRALQLANFALGRDIAVSVSHTSRSLILASFFLRIPTVAMYDYEYVSTSLANRLSRSVLVPSAIPDDTLRSIGVDLCKLTKYEGVKENLYIPQFDPDRDILSQLGLDEEQIIAVLRPPGTVGHYHDHKSEQIMSKILNIFAQRSDVQLVILPRVAQQRHAMESALKSAKCKIVIPHSAVDGLSLIWHSDLLISGGGTMIREAAMLGVPSYSIFTGKVGAVDNYLASTGKLSLVRDMADVGRIKIAKRAHIEFPREKASDLVKFVVNAILSVADAD